MSINASTGLLMGGAGGVYLLAEPGPMTIELEKRDLHYNGRHTELRIILAGPDRRIVQEATIPCDGQPAGSGIGPPQRVRLSTMVPATGVYALNVTVSQDRYGEDCVWGFRTSCPRYLIETSRGHRDARHEEPIVLAGGPQTADICFVPRPAAFTVEVRNLPAGSAPLLVYNPAGALIASLPVSPDGRATGTIEADRERGSSPWRLHLPRARGTIHIDGLTRWDTCDPHANLSLWTDRLETFFPFQSYRWLLTPYHRRLHTAPATSATTPLRLHNNGADKTTLDLAVEYPGDPFPVSLSATTVTLEPGEARVLDLRLTAATEGSVHHCRVRATPRETPRYTTYASIAVHATPAPASRTLDMPVLLTPYNHENEQFGYLPDYPLDAEVYFAPDQRPYTLTGGTLATLRDGRWQHIELQQPHPAATPGPLRTRTKVAFDASGGLYIAGSAGRRDVLLHAASAHEAFTVCPLDADPAADAAPGRSSCDIEQFSGHNVPAGPPPVLRAVEVAADDQLIWRRISTLDLILPEKRDGKLHRGQTVRIAAATLGVGSHSGIPSAVVSRGQRVHVIWAEPTDPGADVPGVPTFVSTYDRDTGRLSEPVLIGYGAPPNDVHNRPSITMDSRGYLHALAGTHGAPFQYAQSLQPDDAAAGWTEPVPVGDRQTYIGLVCGPDDVLHLVYRMWRSHQEPHPHSMHASLAYQRKPPGQPWSAPRVLLAAPFSEYSIFYHKLTIDRRGRLFLSYDYWSTYWFYRTDHVGSRRALMMSPDGGSSWKLVQTLDLR